jgi:hypothetical protein
MRTIGQVLRVTLALLVFVTVLELCARLDDRICFGAPMWRPYNIDNLYENDALGKHGKPYARYKKWQLNSLGFRGPELRDGTVRIVCFGASETFGLYEEPGKEYPRQLEDDLNAWAGSPRFQVVNVAYPGQSVATSVTRVPEIVSKIHPRFAVIYPALAEYIWLPWLPPSRAVAPDPPAAPRLEWRLADRLKAFAKPVVPLAFQTWLRKREIVSASAKFPALQCIGPESEARFRFDLLRLTQELQAAGVTPILVTHATTFGSAASGQSLSERDRDLLISWRKFYPMLQENGFIDMERKLNETMRDLARGQNLKLIDAARRLPAGEQYFSDFSHLTNRGAAVMAGELAQEIIPLLAQPAGSAPPASKPVAARPQSSAPGDR